MIEKQILVLPHWIEQVLSRNNCPLDRCLDYSVVRQYLSLEDLAGLLCVQELKLIDKSGMSDQGTLFRSWLSSADVAQKAELMDSVRPLSCNNELKQDVILRLREIKSGYLTDDDAEEEIKTYFRIVDSTRKIAFLIVYPGFLQRNSIAQYRYNVVVELLKVFYRYMKVYQVSALPLFSEYVSLFSAQPTLVSSN